MVSVTLNDHFNETTKSKFISISHGVKKYIFKILFCFDGLASIFRNCLYENICSK